LEHTDPAGAGPRRSYAQIAGIPTGGKQASALAIIQHAGNPQYPGDWVKYPKLAWLQPTFPAQGRRYVLTKGKTLTLQYRLWIRPGGQTSEAMYTRQWELFNDTPKPASGRMRP